MKLRPKRRLLWDIETDGLLPELTRVHILAIRDLDTRQTWVFRKNEHEDTILDGIAMLNEAEYLTGHNIIGFDMKALWKLYGDAFNPTGLIRDTLVLARMMFADQKEHDFRLWKRGVLDGGLIGAQGLEAWGQRLGFPKGDYAKVRKALAAEQWAADPRLHELWADVKAFQHWLTWGEWNQKMEDYCYQDLNVNEALWLKIERVTWSEFAIQIEHRVHDMMERVKENGFPFDLERARILEAELRATHDKLAEEAIAHFGRWWVPKKWNRSEKGYAPREEFGENRDRKNWGEVNVPKKDMRWRTREIEIAKGGNKTAGAAYTPIELKEFNPNSRPQIIDRLKTVYDWEPQEFTETGTPKVDDEVLRDLASTIPIAETLAELFYFKKRLGQLVDGKNGWIGKAEERGDGKIHPTINVGGTITNRATHSDPNIAQVPRVVAKKLKQWLLAAGAKLVLGLKNGKITYAARRPDGSIDTELTPLLGDDGVQVEKKAIIKGRAGAHGYDCRDLFYVPEGWVLMGADQKGIELRALAHFMFPYDQGEYRRLVVEGDPHAFNQEAMGIDSRDVAKTAIYALIYGASDFKLGCTVEPMLSNYPLKAKALGAQIRQRLLSRIPALAAVVKSVEREAKRGYVEALDGRQLFVRAKHAALNTKLQGAGATVAKLWCILFEEKMEAEGFVHGWDGDFAVLAWVHDELQVAVRDDPRITEAAERLIAEAAHEAGRQVEFACPVDVDVKFGRTWAETH